MDAIKGFFDSFKEFIWDIIGYLLPGGYILIILAVSVNQEYFLFDDLTNPFADYTPLVYIVFAYILGYTVYGLGILKEEILGSRSYTKRIELQISKRKVFILSKNIINGLLASKGLNEDISGSTVRDIRSIVMSFIPEQDQKIYTFTFRSELSNQAGNISILVGLLGVAFVVFDKWLPMHIFKIDLPYIVLYICLIFSYLFLRKARNRFYAISVSLPFSIYTANVIKK